MAMDIIKTGFAMCSCLCILDVILFGAIYEFSCMLINGAYHRPNLLWVVKLNMACVPFKFYVKFNYS